VKLCQILQIIKLSTFFYLPDTVTKEITKTPVDFVTMDTIKFSVQKARDEEILHSIDSEDKSSSKAEESQEFNNKTHTDLSKNLDILLILLPPPFLKSVKDIPTKTEEKEIKDNEQEKDKHDKHLNNAKDDNNTSKILSETPQNMETNFLQVTTSEPSVVKLRFQFKRGEH